MIDPLSCLREYTIKKKPIIEKNNFIIFGEYSWPKSVKTNYRIFNKQKDAAEEYYTLECLVFLLNHLKFHHVDYVNFARKNDVPYVRRPDRKKLLAYLMGEISTSPSIDTSAPVVYPTKIKLEDQKEITDVVSCSNFLNSLIMSCSEADVQRNKCQSSFNPHNPAISVKQELEEQEEINIKPSTEELSLLSSTETNFSRNDEQFPSLQQKVKEENRKINKKQRIENSSTLSICDASISRNKDQRYFNSDHFPSTVKQEIEEKEEFNIKPSIEELSLLSSTETNFSRNDKQFPSLQKVIEVKEEIRKANKKRRIKNSSTLSSSEASISRNKDKKYFNCDYIPSTVKQEVKMQDDIDIKPIKLEKKDYEQKRKKQRIEVHPDLTAKILSQRL